MLAWFVENAAALTPLVAVVFAAIGFLIRRRVTGERHKENTESIERAVQLKRLLDAEGMTLEEALHVRDLFRSGRVTALQAEARAAVTNEGAVPLNSQDWRTEIVPFEDTMSGMKLKASAELDELNGQIRFALADLAHLCTEARAKALHDAQESWELFRDREAHFGALRYEGGSLAALVELMDLVELTKTRLGELREARMEIESWR